MRDKGVGEKETCICADKRSIHRTNEDGDTYECYFDNGDYICCCRKFQPVVPASNEEPDRDNLEGGMMGNGAEYDLS